MLGALAGQIESFVRDNPPAFGAHWGSGQEAVIRLIAWMFAAHAGLRRNPSFASAIAAIETHARDVLAHLRHTIDYARIAVPNNHLFTEALGMYVLGVAFGNERARDDGRAMLSAEVERQFYEDGGYLQQSHTYHRAVLQLLLWGIGVSRANGEGAPPSWIAGVARSVEFLVQQQNPGDGRLPNYGANDGTCPIVLSCGAFADFRPDPTSREHRGARRAFVRRWALG